MFLKWRRWTLNMPQPISSWIFRNIAKLMLLVNGLCKKFHVTECLEINGIIEVTKTRPMIVVLGNTQDNYIFTKMQVAYVAITQLCRYHLKRVISDAGVLFYLKFVVFTLIKSGQSCLQKWVSNCHFVFIRWLDKVKNLCQTWIVAKSTKYRRNP